MGFARREIIDRGEYFLVEGDIVFWKRDLRSPAVPPTSPDSPIFQWRTTNGVSGPNVMNIRVSIDSQLSTSWEDAVRQALVEWNAVSGTLIYFAEGTPADIVIRPSSDLPTGVVAQASWPANAKPGPTVDVSTSFEGLTSGAKLFVLAHELGHTIGFRHTNWNVTVPNCPTETAGSIGANRIGFTPDTDAYSVMNKCSAGTEWSGFSFWDIEAARVMYSEAPVLWSNEQITGDSILMTWTSVPGAIGYRITYQWRFVDLDPEGNPYYHYVASAQDVTDTVWYGGTYTGLIGCDASYQIQVLFQGGGGGNSNQVHVADCSPAEWDW
jgi:hypothetical protein